AVAALGIANLRPNLVALVGRLKYRFSFGQNVLAHSIEVATMMGAIAADIGLDEQLARRAGLLHDIGKAVDHEVEGSHALIGADLLQRAGENPLVVNAVAAHHEDTEKTSLLAELVQICDTLSAGRPGARAETTELYLKRLEDLERIGNSFAGVESCYAIQAGRELRVLVKPEKVTEAQAAVLAHDLAERIEKEMRYPGQIRVSVIRETRAIEYAK
ncbi:MAG: HDIG domain-containing protein, partial [Victivallales bacterium]|nr:HDIG domain-containing protein [Victivallales bacterium]